MADSNKSLEQAEKDLEKAVAKLQQTDAALRADQLVNAVADAAVPNLAQNAPQQELGTPPAAGKAGTLDEEMQALRENEEKTKQAEILAEAGE